MYMKFSSDWEAVPKFVNVAEIFWNSLGKQIWKMKNNFKILCPVPVAGYVRHKHNKKYTADDYLWQEVIGTSQWMAFYHSAINMNSYQARNYQ